MTTRLTILAIIGSLLVAARVQAANTYTQLQPGKTGDASRVFAVEVKRFKEEKKGEYLRINVTVRAVPGREPLSPILLGDLEVFDGEEVISSSALKPTLRGREAMYSFLVAAKFAKESKFSFGEILHAPNGEPLDAANYYWFYLRDFVDAK
jgi:hypothetical protein